MAVLRLVAEGINGDDALGDTLEIGGDTADESYGDPILQFKLMQADVSFFLSSVEDITQLIAYCTMYLHMYKQGELG